MGYPGSVVQTVDAVSAALLAGCDLGRGPAARSALNAGAWVAQAPSDEVDAATPFLASMTLPVSQGPVTHQT